MVKERLDTFILYIKMANVMVYAEDCLLIFCSLAFLKRNWKLPELNASERFAEGGVAPILGCSLVLASINCHSLLAWRLIINDREAHESFRIFSWLGTAVWLPISCLGSLPTVLHQSHRLSPRCSLVPCRLAACVDSKFFHQPFSNSTAHVKL